MARAAAVVNGRQAPEASQDKVDSQGRAGRGAAARAAGRVGVAGVVVLVGAVAVAPVVVVVVPLLKGQLAWRLPSPEACAARVLAGTAPRSRL